MKYLVNTLTGKLRQTAFPSDSLVKISFFNEGGYVRHEIITNLKNLHKHTMQLRKQNSHSMGTTISGHWFEVILILV
jgi:hypothetical protein